jgi:hypothetical protein
MLLLKLPRCYNILLFKLLKIICLFNSWRIFGYNNLPCIYNLLMLFFPWEINFLQYLISNLLENTQQLHVLFILTKFNSLFYHCNMIFLHNMIILPFCHNLNIGLTTKVEGTKTRWRSKECFRICAHSYKVTPKHFQARITLGIIIPKCPKCQ